MSDFEDRLRRALEEGVADAPGAGDLASGARRRARVRRRTTLAVTAAAVVLAVVAVPVGLRAAGGDEARRTGPASTPSGPTAVPDGWRTETWHDLEVEVPDGWGYGHLRTWCLDSAIDSGRPVVERPGGLVQAIGCIGPASGYGVQFFVPGAATDHKELYRYPRDGKTDDYPAGAWVGHAVLDARTAVRVVAADRATAERILASVRRVGDLDANGCPPGDTPDAGPSGEGASVCRYSHDGRLEQSERLVGRDAEEAVAAMTEAPETAYAPPCPGEAAPAGRRGEYVVLRAQGVTYQIAWTGDPCRDRGVFVDASSRHRLTPDVMYWALSPGWSGSVAGDVPMPHRLRQGP